MSRPRALVIDGNHLLYRCFYGLPYLSAPDGTPTNAVFGVLNRVKDALEMFQPVKCVVAWDGGGKSWRHAVLSTYKESHHRGPVNAARSLASVQLDVLEKMFGDVLRLPQIRVPGVEGDDAVAFAAMKLRAWGYRPVIMSGDHDFVQLVDRVVTVYDPMKVVWFNLENFEAESVHVRPHIKMASPAQYLDWMIINGDAGDDIPIVKGLSGAKRFGEWSKHLSSPLASLLVSAGMFEGRCPAALREKFLPRFDELHRNWTLLDLEYAVTSKVALAWPDERHDFDKARLWETAQQLSFRTVMMEFESWVKTLLEYHERARRER